MPLVNQTLLVPQPLVPPQKIAGSNINRGILGAVTIGAERRTNVPDTPPVPMPYYLSVVGYPHNAASPNPWPTIPSAGDFSAVGPDMAGRGSIYQQVQRNG